MIPYFLKPHNSVDIDNHDDLHLEEYYLEINEEKNIDTR